MRFSDILSHETVKRQLVSMVDSGKIAHAILLEGPAGIGKYQLARAFAQYIHCTNRSGGDSCGCCPSCIQHQSFNHIDTHYSFPVIKKGSLSSPVSDDWIAEWRQFLSETPYMDFEVWQEMLGNPNAQPVLYVDESASLIKKLNYTAHAASHIVVIMWLPERMNEQCANKLLKLIEEPHADTIFVLVSNEPAKILPTIYSRLRRIEVKRLSDDAIASWLAKSYSIDIDRAKAVSRLSGGSMLSAIRKLDSDSDDKSRLMFFMSLMRLAYQRDIRNLKKWSLDVADLGREKCIKLLDYFERLVGENYIYNLHYPELVRLDDNEAGFSKNFARFINERNVESLRRLFMDARRDIAGNCNAKIVMFDIAVKTILLIKL